MFSSFRYHNEPEGKNLKDKVSSLVRIGGLFGMYHATHHLLKDIKRTSWPIMECANIYAGYMAVPMAVGFTYATVRYALTNIRHKDDKWNGFLAGAANAPLVYAWLSHRMQSQSRIIVLLPILCGYAALALEYAYQNALMDLEVQHKSMVRSIGDRPPTYSTYKLQ